MLIRRWNYPISGALVYKNSTLVLEQATTGNLYCRYHRNNFDQNQPKSLFLPDAKMQILNLICSLFKNSKLEQVET